MNNTVSFQTLQAELQGIMSGLANGAYKPEDYPRIYARISQIEADLKELQVCYKAVSSAQ